MSDESFVLKAVECEGCGQQVLAKAYEDTPNPEVTAETHVDCPSKNWFHADRLNELISATVDVYVFYDDADSPDYVQPLRNLLVLGQQPRGNWAFKDKMPWCSVCYKQARQRCFDNKHVLVTDKVHYIYPQEIVGIVVQ